MIKKTLVCILFFMFILSSAMVCAGEMATFDIAIPESLPSSGETFDVMVNIDNNPGFCAVQFELAYDKSAMVCNSVSVGALLEDSLSVTNPDAKGSVIVSAASLDPLQGNGALAVCSFTAKEDIEEFNFKLKNISFSDKDANPISYRISGESDDSDNEVAPSLPPAEEAPSRPSTGNNSQSGGTSFIPVTKPTVTQPDKKDEDTPSEEILTPTTPDTESDEEKIPVMLFSDVSGHWAESYIAASVEKGLFKGDDKGRFNPDQNITRAQFVTVLWRMAGMPNVDAEVPFTDIENQIPEFKSAIKWGYSNGYINGTSPTTFNPNGTLTREAGMKILHYYSGGKTGEEGLLTAIYDGTFTDSNSISDWAKPSMYWGVYNELISGTSATTLSPKGTATRAQLAKILVNYADTYNK